MNCRNPSPGSSLAHGEQPSLVRGAKLGHPSLVTQAGTRCHWHRVNARLHPGSAGGFPPDFCHGGNPWPPLRSEVAMGVVFGSGGLNSAGRRATIVTPGIRKD